MSRTSLYFRRLVIYGDSHSSPPSSKMQSDQRAQSMKPEKTPNPLESASMCWAKTGLLQNGDVDEKMMIYDDH